MRTSGGGSMAAAAASSSAGVPMTLPHRAHSATRPRFDADWTHPNDTDSATRSPIRWASACISWGMHGRLGPALPASPLVHFPRGVCVDAVGGADSDPMLSRQFGVASVACLFVPSLNIRPGIRLGTSRQVFHIAVCDVN